ncbi:GNAT family N-acetyltransferase [Pedobacter cryoconitis]|uniref:Ribosomal protein S18 acetylase RimI-like enzyme n=1 Tax=Pedobacter cryoconitis TaxID=188932 RepID=A0A327T3A5_9SPHI|nr:GNAT family N-acetyltransferase [Pedobacter cryoconitis]RAJ34193.1 ribosomal protein S18 acetylase RimI-like enzyme [Pedobacter cryoconitis]
MITLRKAKEEDVSIIQRIGTLTFRPTYGHILDQVQIDYMLDQFYSIAALTKQLMEGHTFLIAQEGDQDLAFAAYSTTTHQQHIVTKLHKLYVLPEAHGKGLGKLLMNEVRNKAIEAGADTLTLNVNRYNNAKDFYEKMGFVVKETVDIEIGNGFFMNDYVMALPLTTLKPA